MAIFCIFWALGCSVNLPDLDQPLIVGPISAVSERGDIAFSIGPPSKASNRIPSPSESYTVIVQPLGQIYLVKESKGTQALGWRNHVNKSSLTVAVSSSDPNSNIWIEVEPSDNGSYQIVSHALPYDLLPYAVSWSPDGNILALAAIRWASDERLIGLITDEFETSMRVYFCASPKGIVWRDNHAFWARANDVIYLVLTNEVNLVPKPVSKEKDMFFHAFEDKMLIWSENNHVFFHDQKVYSFSMKGPTRVLVDLPYIAVRDANEIVVIEVPEGKQYRLPVQPEDMLLGISKQRQSIFVTKGLDRVEEAFFGKEWQCEEIFDLQSVYDLYTQEKGLAKKELKVGNQGQSPIKGK
jgi:hypothetical protein